ncbi:hypothetical protein G5714_008099 [Onychostoma macrolepis]|uniref:G-protein coupled receptors family 1 profile domain-containing protein n=1 Tax=Onychostoma macrolepis TaxID=369639 RepID=A0A7J6CUR1_9TELE|nr:hypothetical protein G5714_008099 [Onychostoma macrolepis]
MNISFPYSDNDTVPGSWSSAGDIAACVILGVCFLVGTPGNLLVVWTILKHVKQRSHTVLLILHLAAADLLVLVTLPLWIYSLAHYWVFGEAACKVMVYIINACMYSSVFIITIMSVERFLAIRYPLQMLYWQNRMSMFRILAVSWILSFILGIPVILTQYVNEDDDGMKHCFFREYNSVSFEVFCLCLETHYSISHTCNLLLSGCRTAPKGMVLLLLGQSDEWSHIPNSVVFISGALAFISNSVNPVLYAFASKNLHGSLKKSGIVKLFQDLTTQTQKGFSQDSGLQDGNILEDPSGGEREGTHRSLSNC